MRHRTFWGILTLALAAGAAGCSEPNTAAAASIMRVLEERRAQAIIERALADNGVKPLPGREFALKNGKTLREDFAVAGTAYGVAYITEDEAAQFGAVLPKRDREDGRLSLFRPDSQAFVLLLYQDDYRFDIGSAHSTTAVTAEQTLARDVTDFVIHVVKQDAAR